MMIKWTPGVRALNVSSIIARQRRASFRSQ